MSEARNVDKNLKLTELLSNPDYLPSKKCSGNITLKWILVSTITICVTVIVCVTTALVLDLVGMLLKLVYTMYTAFNSPSLLLQRKVKFHQKLSDCLQVACPDEWIGFHRKCFYFSFDIKNWTSSKRFCDSQGSGLVQVETFQEMDFLLRYKGPSDHWIGLSREQGPPWKWTNDIQISEWFHIRGAGECAYLNDKGISSSRSYTERKWICSKPLFPNQPFDPDEGAKP